VGVILLLIVALVALLAIGVGMILWEALHPPRRTAAWAAAHRLPMDPGETGMSFREWTLDRPDGAALPVWDIDLSANAATDTSEGACTVVMLHGWARSRIDSLDRLLALIGAVPNSIGRAVLVDLRGHGDARGPGCRLGATEVDDVLELLGRIDDDRVVVAGHSMGAVLAIAAVSRAAPALKARIRGVIAWAPYRRVASPIANRLRFRNAPVTPLVPLTLLVARPFVAATLDTVERARDLGVPLLVVAAGQDTIAPTADAEAIADAGSGDLVTLPTAAHGNIHNSDPDLHAAALRTWFARLGAAAERSASTRS